MAQSPDTIVGRPSWVARVPSGDAGVKLTLQLMRRVVLDYRKNTIIRYQAVALTSGLRQHDYLSEIRCIHEFVRDCIRYVRDTRQVETIQTPLCTLEERAGDCDDKTTLFCALAESIGFKTAFKAVALNGSRIGHVYPLVIWQGRGIAAEVIRPVALGWEPDSISRFIIREV